MGVTMIPADLAGSMWAPWAGIRVELGIVDTWAPTGDQWDGGVWDLARWGESYLTPSRWLDVTRDVMSVDVDTGRNGVDDPGEIGTANLTVSDLAGEYAIAGSAHSALGNLLHIVATHAASATARSIFYGRVTEASSIGDLGAPAVTVRAVDLLGAVLSTDDAAWLPAQSVRERLGELLDRAGVPAALRDLADDATALLPVEKAGNRLDAARGAVASSVGATFYATGAGVMTYRHGTFFYGPGSVAAYSIGTVPGSICPSALDLAEKGAAVLNYYSWTTAEKDAPLTAWATDVESVARYGRGASVRTDLLNSKQGELGAIVESELARTAWAPERVDHCSVEVHDDESAGIVVCELEALVDFTYTGSAPWSSRQILGSYAHHVTPDSWTIELRAYPALLAALWDVSEWDVGEWTLGAVPTESETSDA